MHVLSAIPALLAALAWMGAIGEPGDDFVVMLTWASIITGVIAVFAAIAGILPYKPLTVGGTLAGFALLITGYGTAVF